MATASSSSAEDAAIRYLDALARNEMILRLAAMATIGVTAVTAIKSLGRLRPPTPPNFK